MKGGRYVYTWDRKKIGKNLRIMRVKKDLSQAALAEALGVAQGHYSNIELGKRQLSLHLLAKICELFGVNPAEIIADIDEPSASPDPEGEKAEV